MPRTIFDWIARTAMLVMAGLVTLSILGAIDTMTRDTGTRFAGPGDRPPAEARQPEEPENAQAPSGPAAGDAESNPAASGSPGSTVAAARPEPEDEAARWLEAIAYALLALAGIGALGVLMLWSILRELRRIGDRPR